MTHPSPIEALRQAVDVLGSQAATARLLGVSQPSVWRWLHKDVAVPPEHALKLEVATGVSKYDIRPDIFQREAVTPKAEDGRFEHAR